MDDKLSTKEKGKGSKNKEEKKSGSSMGHWIFLLTILLLITFMAFSFVKYFFWGDELPVTISFVQQVYTYDKTLPKRIGESEVYSGPDLENDIYQAQKAYEEEQFPLAIKHFNNSLTDNPERFDLKLYTALTHIHLGKDDLAQQLLYQIIEHPDKSLYANEALWYSALIDLKNNNIVESKKSLDDLIKRNTNTKQLLGKAVGLRDKLEGVHID
jgi:tetratricopeptide (TPR) repeat protein